MSAFDGLDPGAAMTKPRAVPTCDQGHGEMGPDIELDQDGDPTGNLLWTCQVCCWSLPRGKVKWADQSEQSANQVKGCGKCVGCQRGERCRLPPFSKQAGGKGL